MTRYVTMMAVVDNDKCTGCKVCQKVCPTLAVQVIERKSQVDETYCTGCGACEQRCPVYAISMQKRQESKWLKVDVATADSECIHELCKKAKLHPEQIVCYCTTTRAEEVAAAILNGARSPEDISRLTGLRTGCKVECIQPALRLLQAAGIQPKPPENGYQWYGLTPTIWDLSEEVKAKHNHKGFYFDEDIKLLNRLAGITGKEAE